LTRLRYEVNFLFTHYFSTLVLSTLNNSRDEIKLSQSLSPASKPSTPGNVSPIAAANNPATTTISNNANNFTGSSHSLTNQFKDQLQKVKESGSKFLDRLQQSLRNISKPEEKSVHNNNNQVIPSTANHTEKLEESENISSDDEMYSGPERVIEYELIREADREAANKFPPVEQQFNAALASLNSANINNSNVATALLNTWYFIPSISSSGRRLLASLAEQSNHSSYKHKLHTVLAVRSVEDLRIAFRLVTTQYKKSLRSNTAVLPLKLCLFTHSDEFCNYFLQNYVELVSKDHRGWEKLQFYVIPVQDSAVTNTIPRSLADFDPSYRSLFYSWAWKSAFNSAEQRDWLLPEAFSVFDSILAYINQAQHSVKYTIAELTMETARKQRNFVELGKNSEGKTGETTSSGPTRVTIAFLSNFQLISAQKIRRNRGNHRRAVSDSDLDDISRSLRAEHKEKQAILPIEKKKHAARTAPPILSLSLPNSPNFAPQSGQEAPNLAPIGPTGPKFASTSRIDKAKSMFSSFKNKKSPFSNDSESIYTATAPSPDNPLPRRNNSHRRTNSDSDIGSVSSKSNNINAAGALVDRRRSLSQLVSTEMAANNAPGAVDSRDSRISRGIYHRIHLFVRLHLYFWAGVEKRSKEKARELHKKL
jgi:hypothetical protein